MSANTALDPIVEDVLQAQEPAPAVLTGPRSSFNAVLARYGMYLSVFGLLLIVLTVAWQVFGRYVLHNPPTWAESLALLLVLYVTLIAAAVGVRDAGHIGMESLLAIAPERIRVALERVIHAMVAFFGSAMVYNGWLLGASVAHYKISGLGLSEGLRYVPLVISGTLIVLFSIEHIIASLRSLEVKPSWH
ncbi:TRAP transporter small permease [Xylophilus sp.]|uniref:TRAP transporter small permease n=1 Tax=Xylophilus sp. TaxID=2653893 RepID=UPI002D804E11|nr:TRAP transporter small permease [Xylophilus sp.]